ncbi:PQQ-dependent sugar dehydrogenase [Rhizobium sp. TRM95111]|uniref:PQQ-dependent sugar dehydrogenase n=1 Tax=Rhizobium alarense TaxID=2846851 RepID=UPI001F2AE2D1|nr:PQQ-dependent sugar dehydrogenase [Rhizobium alarense]MCF3640754.1 PQQ-dependent sugar dehydrogenase [Rhizobium alarense]
MFPERDGDLPVSALKDQLPALSAGIPAEERLCDGAFGRLRDVHVAPDAVILVLTDGGGLLRASRAPASEQAPRSCLPTPPDATARSGRPSDRIRP